MYVHQKRNWPNFTYDLDALTVALGDVRHKQGKLWGLVNNMGFVIKDETLLKTITQDVIKSSEIEGVLINLEEVRSSVARKLGLNVGGLVPSDRSTDGVVEMMVDATQNHASPLTKERLFAWHSSLFPFGKSGHYQIEVGKWRDDSTGAMQVVSGAMGKEHVHFEAPAATKLEAEMTQFLEWFNKNDRLDPVLKAGIAHFWFVTIHPFDDGNGRIARALTDMQLARSEGDSQRYYSLSSQIRIERKAYYELLEKCQRGNLDISDWLEWFVNCMNKALDASNEALKDTFAKAQFWQNHQQTSLNERQRFMLNKLFDDFFGSLSSSKWAKMAKTSPDTALRDIQDLINKGILIKDENAGGRSTNYVLL